MMASSGVKSEREFTRRCCDFGCVHGSRDARRSAAHARGQFDAPLQQVELRVAGAGNAVVMDRVVDSRFRRERQFRIPQRARAKHGAVLLVDRSANKDRKGERRSGDRRAAR